MAASFVSIKISLISLVFELTILNEFCKANLNAHKIIFNLQPFMNSDLWLCDNLVGGWARNKIYDERARLIEEYWEEYWMFVISEM